MSGKELLETAIDLKKKHEEVKMFFTLDECIDEVAKKNNVNAKSVSSAKIVGKTILK
jgi:hypothetical protein